MRVSHLVNSFFNSCTYVLDMADGHVWVVDSGDYRPLAAMLTGKRVLGILLTHGHFDHIYGLNDLCERFPEAAVYTNAAGRDALLSDKLNLSKYHGTPFVFDHPDRVRIVGHNDRIDLIPCAAATVLATPGHHPSCLTYIVGHTLFTGDAYIPGVPVVTNLPGGNKVQAAQSVELILGHAAGYAICPGHPAPLPQ